jgi:hypothetical protein
MTLSIKDLKEKILKVEQDLRNLSEQGGSIQAVSTLTSYKEYLEDELRMVEQAERNENR